jgi:hypothetical protein
MGRLNRNDYGGERLPALRHTHLDGASAGVLTMERVSEGRIPDFNAPGGSRPVVRVYTQEFPEHVFYMNPAGVTACIEKYGEHTEGWEGQPLPVVVAKTTNPISKRTVEALHVAPLKDWDGIIDGTGVVEDDEPEEEKAPKPRSRAPKNTTKNGKATTGKTGR